MLFVAFIPRIMVQVNCAKHHSHTQQASKGKAPLYLLSSRVVSEIIYAISVDIPLARTLSHVTLRGKNRNLKMQSSFGTAKVKFLPR